MTYVLPLRWHTDTGLAELTDYLRSLAERVEVLVVDGSPPTSSRGTPRRGEGWSGTSHPTRASAGSTARCSVYAPASVRPATSTW